MNDFINKNDKVLELGSGASLLKEFINNNIETSDLSDFDHIDHHNIDACKIDFPDQSFDVVISSNLIHHIAYPLKHFQEVNRILKNNGFIPCSGCKLLIIFPTCSHDDEPWRI